MPLPTAYDETTLAAYMRDGVLQSTGAILGLTDVAQFAEAVTDVVLALGLSSVAAATNMALLRAQARLAAWDLACTVAAGDSDFSSLGVTVDRDQLYGNCAKQRAAAADALTIVQASGSSTAVPRTPWSGAVRVEVGW